MNANRLYIMVFFVSYICFSQTKEVDAYYILDKNHKDYILKSQDGRTLNIDNIYKINDFRLFDRSQYEKVQKQIEDDKRKGEYIGRQFYERPDKLVFTIVRKTTIKHCNLHNLNLVDYKWIQDNTWKENNPNILFKDLYFLFEVQKGKFIKFKVKRTVIAY